MKNRPQIVIIEIVSDFPNYIEIMVEKERIRSILKIITVLLFSTFVIKII